MTSVVGFAPEGPDYNTAAALGDARTQIEEYAIRLRKRPLKPEERLLLAVLDLAIRDAQREPTAGVEDEDHEDAVRWFDETTEEWVTHFVPLCEQMEFDPIALRDALRAGRIDMGHMAEGRREGSARPKRTGRRWR